MRTASSRYWGTSAVPGGGDVPQPHGIAVQLQQHPAEPGKLFRRGGSAPEVGEDALHPQVVQREYPLHLLRLLRQKAEAAKAGIHRQMHPRIHVQRVDGLGLSQTLHRQNDPPL